MPRPRPRLPPVTTMLRMTILRITTLRIMTRQFSGRADVQRRDEADRGGHLVLGQAVATDLQDFALESHGAIDRAAMIELHSENHVGDHDRAGDRVLSRSDKRHPNLWMAVDHRLDLLRMDLQPADIDDSTSPSGEIAAVSAQLHDVAGIDETLGIQQCRAFGPQ